MACGVCAAAEVDECRGPGAGREDDEVRVQFVFSVGKGHADDFVSPPEEQPGRCPRAERDAARLFDFAPCKLHGGFGVGPAAAAVDIAPVAAVSARAEHALDLGLVMQSLDLIRRAVSLGQLYDVLQALAHILVVAVVGGQKQSALRVSPLSAPCVGTRVAP